MDLSRGHLVALRDVRGVVGGTTVYNLGTGSGHTVREMIAAFASTTQQDILAEVGPRRDGDVAVLLADPRKIREELGWEAQLSLTTMCEDLWRWQRGNPQGYGSTTKQ